MNFAITASYCITVYLCLALVPQAGADERGKVLDWSKNGNPDTYLPKLAHHPNVETLIVGSLAFTDKHLDQLGELKGLKHLILDSTDVSCQALEAFREFYPDVTVYRSQRLAILAIEKLDREPISWPTKSIPLSSLQGVVDEAHFEKAISVDFSQAMHISERWGQISDVDLLYLKCLPTLRRLDLASTGITDKTLETVGDLRNMVELRLDYNNLGDEGAQHLRHLLKLRSLSFRETHLTDDGMAFLQPLLELKMLVVTSDQMGSEGLRHLAGLPKLEFVMVSGRFIDDDALVHLQKLTQLTTLGLQETKVTDMVGIEKCESLTTLDLTESRVSDDGLKNIGTLQQLKSLDLRRSGVTDVGIAHLAVLTKLKWLCLTDTAVTKEGVARLQEQLPKCKISVRFPTDPERTTP